MPVIVMSRKKPRQRISGRMKGTKIHALQGNQWWDEAVASGQVRVHGRNKYGATATTVDGIRFASKREARRYLELRLLEQGGKIFRLELQPRFPFDIPGLGAIKTKRGSTYEYRADFAYWIKDPAGKMTRRIEDAKGHDTPLSALKRAIVHTLYGVHILLT